MTRCPALAGTTCPNSTCRRLVLGDGRAESHTPTLQAHAHARMHARRKTRAKTQVRALPNVRTTHASLLPEHDFCGLLRRTSGKRRKCRCSRRASRTGERGTTESATSRLPRFCLAFFPPVKHSADNSDKTDEDEVADGTAGSLPAFFGNWPMSFHSPWDARS